MSTAALATRVVVDLLRRVIFCTLSPGSRPYQPCFLRLATLPWSASAAAARGLRRRELRSAAGRRWCAARSPTAPSRAGRTPSARPGPWRAPARGRDLRGAVDGRELAGSAPWSRRGEGPRRRLEADVSSPPPLHPPSAGRRAASAAAASGTPAASRDRGCLRLPPPGGHAEHTGPLGLTNDNSTAGRKPREHRSDPGPTCRGADGPPRCHRPRRRGRRDHPGRQAPDAARRRRQGRRRHPGRHRRRDPRGLRACSTTPT